MEGFISPTRGKEKTLKPGRRREDNIEIKRQEVGWGKGGEHGLGYLAEDSDKWRAFVNEAMNLEFHKSREIS
jgi:hypothetical protein